MPYGLPALERARVLDRSARWLEAGAPYEGAAPLPPGAAQLVRTGRRFSMATRQAERLMSRYLYEHLFLGHLSFDTDPRRRAFRIVRSAHAARAGRRRSSPRGVRTTIPALPASTTAWCPRARPCSPRRTCPTRSAPGGWRSCAAGSSTPAFRCEPAGYAPERHRTRSSASAISARGALPLPARRGGVLRHEFHQGPGLPRPAGARRDRGPLLGLLRRPEGGRRRRGRRIPGRRTRATCACRPSGAAPHRS